MPQSRNFALLTRDEIAIELARIALAAGTPIMQIYAEGCAQRDKADGSPVTEADERAEAIIHARLSSFGAGGPSWSPRRRSPAARRSSKPTRILPRRSPRRHARIPRPQRRIHRQCRADPRGRTGRRRGLCPGARPVVVRRRDAAYGCRGAGRRAACRPFKLARGCKTRSRAASADRAREPFARRPATEAFLQPLPARRPQVGGFVAEILRRRRGRGRRLSALRADDGMGHRGGRRGAEGRGRRRARRARALRSSMASLPPGCATARSSPGATPRRRSAGS